VLVTRRVKVALETDNPAWDSLSLTSLQIFLMDAGAAKTSHLLRIVMCAVKRLLSH